MKTAKIPRAALCLFSVSIVAILVFRSAAAEASALVPAESRAIETAPAIEGPDPAFKTAFAKLMAKKDKAEMAKLVHAEVKNAVEWIIHTCEQISEQSSDELETFMSDLREAWKTAQKTEFADRVYKYFSTVSGANKKDRVELKQRYERAFDEMQHNLEKKDSFVFQNLVDEFELLGGAFDEVGDLYDSSQAWLATAACYDEPLRGQGADLYKAYHAYAQALDARDRIELKDPAYEEAFRRKAALQSKGYDKKKAEVAPPPPPPQEPEAPEAPPAAPGSGMSIPLSFEVVGGVDLFQRPVYDGDEIYEIWSPLALKGKGTFATFPNLPNSPPLFRLGSSEVRFDIDGDGVGEEKLNLTGTIAPAKIAIGKGDDQRPWAFLSVTGVPKDSYQSLEINLAPDDKQMTIYTFAAASLVGTIGATQIRIIDESMDGVYGNPPQTWGFIGLSKENYQPVMDSVVIGNAKRARPWSEFQEIDGKWYRLEPVQNGKELKAAPVNVEKGVLKLDYKGPAPTWVVVRGEGEQKNSFFDLVEGGSKGVSVPAGRYSLYYGEMRKGRKRQTQKTLILPGKSAPTWTVSKGQTTVATLGAPYGFDFTVNHAGEKLSIPGSSVVITGSQGERYERTWNCVPKPDVEWRAKGSRQGKKAGRMASILDMDMVTKLGWDATWFPLDFNADLRNAGDKIEVQLAEKKHDLFGKIESTWRE
jgi:hypothetical protein